MQLQTLAPEPKGKPYGSSWLASLLTHAALLRRSPKHSSLAGHRGSSDWVRAQRGVTTLARTVAVQMNVVS